MILFNPETALKLSRNVGKKNQCDSNYLFDEEEARTSWDYVATFGRTDRRGEECHSVGQTKSPNPSTDLLI